MRHYQSCPVCNGTNLHLNFSCRDYLVSNKEFDLFKCSDCGFILTQDHPDSNEIGSFYKSDAYISHSDTKRGLFNFLYHIARKFMLGKKSRLVKKVSGLKTGSILDIGSGTGYFAFAMKEAGWQVTGVEIDEAAREYSRTKFGLNIINSDAIKGLPNESFDCITLWHVLEHLEEPEIYLQEIRRLLKPDGTCIIALPNHLSTDAKHYRQFWAAYDVPRHLWHFSPDVFKLFSERNGFQVIRRVPLPLDAFYISILSEKNKKGILAILNGFYTGLRSYLISVFRQELNSSLVYVIKRNQG